MAAEGFESRTFPMRRESESASRLRAIISDMLPLFSQNYSDDDILSEYITVIVCNGKSQRQARDYLEAFLGEQSGEFVACLWEILLNDFTQGSSSRSHHDYDRKPTTNATYRMNERVISAVASEDVEAHVSPKARSMRMLRQELINSPCKRAQPKQRDDWDLSGVNYTRKMLRSVIVSATEQPRRVNPDRYEKPMKRLNFPEREMSPPYLQYVSSGGSVSARSPNAASCSEMKSHVSVWDRLGQPDDKEYPIVPKFRIQADVNKELQQRGRAFPAAYSEQHKETFQREVPAVAYRHRVFPSHKARKPQSGAITYTEPHIAYNLGRKRRYGIINPNAEDASVGDLSSVLQSKQAKQDVEKPSLLSYQSTKPDLFSELLNMKQKLQQLEIQINQAKQLKKQKVGELKPSTQSGELQDQQVTDSTIIHVTNVHYAARKQAISMLFGKCGAVENVTIVTDPVTLHPMGAAFVTFATKESVNKALALSGTMFYSRPIKVHMITSGVMSQTPAPQVVTGS